MEKSDDRASMERAVEHRERLVTLGTLAAETAHEFNNVLAYVSNNLDVLLDRARRDQLTQLLEPLLEVREGVDQLTALSRTLRDFGAPLVRPALLEVGDVLDRVARMARARLQRSARLERHYHQTLPVRAIEPQLRHALLNVVLNAIEAFEIEDPNRNWIRFRVEVDPAQRAVVTIQNNGRPIPPHQLESIFEQFYTTKERGTGLGLALCRRVVADLGGTLAVESQVESTSFVITLPTVATE